MKVLVRNKVAVVSGLARGIDIAAHWTAINEGGRTISVLGTPLNRVYPRENSQLQEIVMNDHCAVSQFPNGHMTHRQDFVLRNRTMALVSNASVIVEAGETSGSLHQGWEALRLGRPLFIWHSLFRNPSLQWPRKMLDYGAIPLTGTKAVVRKLPSSEPFLLV